jgi:hypothetical protein
MDPELHEIRVRGALGESVAAAFAGFASSGSSADRVHLNRGHRRPYKRRRIDPDASLPASLSPGSMAIEPSAIAAPRKDSLDGRSAGG